MCGPAPSATVVSRSKSYRLRGTERFARREARGRLRFRAVREGMDGFDRFQCSLRLDPAPLRFLEAPRDRALPGGGPEKDQRSSRRMAS